MRFLPSLASRLTRFNTGLRPSIPLRTLVTRGGPALPAADPKAIDSAVATVAGEVGFDQLEPHELKRLREDREKQLDIRNFTLNFGPQHPVRPTNYTIASFASNHTDYLQAISINSSPANFF